MQEKNGRWHKSDKYNIATNMDKCVSVEPGEQIYLYSEGSHLLIETAQVASPSKNYISIA